MSNCDSLYSWKLSSENDDFQVEFEVVSTDTNSNCNKLEDVDNQIQNIDLEIEKIQAKIDVLDRKIEELTNHADGLDYTIAISCGIISGVIDSFFVREFSFDEGSKWGTEKVNNFVLCVAKNQGYKGDDLTDAVSFLEKKWPLAADKATNDFGGGRQHHLRDFSHHASPLGLLFNLLTQFTGKVYGTSTDGSFLDVDVSQSGLIGENLPSKLFLGTVQWFFHLISDVAGSSSSLKMGCAGTGIPGPILSLAKEMSSLPIFKHGGDSFSLWVSKLFNGTLLGERNEAGRVIKARPFDLRAELGLLEQLGKQSMPVIINECIVRAFYFIRRLYWNVKAEPIHSIVDFRNKIHWNKIWPKKNRTIIRMLTIATGTFTAIDLTEAAIRSAKKTGGVNPAFWSSIFLRVNFIGVGRFSIAIFSDVKMELNKDDLKRERQIAYNILLRQINAKIYYKQASTWESAEDASVAVETLKRISEKSIFEYCSEIKKIFDDIDGLKEILPVTNKKLRNDLLDILD